MLNLLSTDALAIEVVRAIQSGDIEALRRLSLQNPGLATARIDDGKASRSLLHIATDFPGHFARGKETVAVLISAGADVNARLIGPHAETPLHWAASCDDVPVLDALLDAGADIEASGAVIAGGSPLFDAVAFGQWKAARRLIERGAQTTLAHAAALGLMDRVVQHFHGGTTPTSERVNHAFWYACHGGQQPAAEYLLGRGADLNWIPSWENRTALDAAQREHASDLVQWLRAQGGKSAGEL